MNDKKKHTKNYILTVIVIFITTVSISAQMTFEKTYGTIDNNKGFSVAVCQDNTFAICGRTIDYYNGSEDIYIIKTDYNGNLIWSKEFGAEYIYAEALDICTSNDSGLIVTGQIIDSNELSQPFLLKLSNDGEKEWIKIYDSLYYSGGGHSVVQAENNDFIFCGSAKISKLVSKPFFIRTNSLGELINENIYGDEFGISSASDITQTSDGNFLLSGLLDNEDEGNTAGLIKTDQAGNMIWYKSYDEYPYCQLFRAVENTSDNGIINVGIQNHCIPSPNSYENIYVVKTDPDGNLQWEKDYGGLDQENASDIALTTDGGYIICGSINYQDYRSDDLYLLKINSEGDSLWTRTFGGNYTDGGSSIKTLSDGSFIICGYTNSFGNGGYDIYLIRTNAEGIATTIINPILLNNKSVVYPNPASDIINISSKNYITKYQIYNSNSKLILSSSSPPNKNIFYESINTCSFAPGIYFIKLYSSNGCESLKFIKIK